MHVIERAPSAFRWLVTIGISPDDDDDLKTSKATLTTLVATVIAVLGGLADGGLILL